MTDTDTTVDSNRRPGRPYFHVGGKARLEHHLERERRHASGAASSYGSKMPWIPDTGDSDPDAARRAIVEIRQAAKGAALLHGPGIQASLLGTPVDAGEELYPAPLDRLGVIGQALDLLSARAHDAEHMSADRQLEVIRLEQELDRAQLAYDAATRRAKSLEAQLTDRDVAAAWSSSYTVSLTAALERALADKPDRLRRTLRNARHLANEHSRHEYADDGESNCRRCGEDLEHDNHLGPDGEFRAADA